MGRDRSRNRARGGVPLWFLKTLGGVAPTAFFDLKNNRYFVNDNKLRVVSVRNQVAQGKEQSVGMDGHLSKGRIKMGCDAEFIVLSFSNKYLSPYSGDQNSGNNITIQDVSIVNEAGTIVVPVTFAGARTKSLVDGTIDAQSDPVLPSSFGLSKFSRDEDYYFKVRCTGAVSFYVPYGQNTYLDATMNDAWWYNTAATTPSSTDAAGNYTAASGAALTSGYNMFFPYVLGKPIGDDFSLIAVGDSLSEGSSDAVSSEWGGGQIQRAMRSASNDDSLPCLNFGIAGTTAQNHAGSALTEAYLKYARYAFCNLGTNDINSARTLPQIQTDLGTLWTKFRTAGIERIIQEELFYYTTGTYLDDAGQTIQFGWGAGEIAEQLKDWLQTKLDDGTINNLISTDSVGSATNDYKWGAGQTTDGIHPAGATGAENMAVILRPLFRSLRSAKNNYVTPSLSDIATYIRTGTATYFDASGNLQTVAANTIRLDHDPMTFERLGYISEETATNLIPNNTCTSAVAGVIDAGGLLPSGWLKSLRGLTVTLELPTVKNMPVARMRISGTPSSSGGCYVAVTPNNTVAALNTNNFTNSVWAKLNAGNLTNVTGLSFTSNIFSGAVAYLQEIAKIDFQTLLDGTFKKHTASGTVSNASAAYIQTLLQWVVVSGQPVDFTVDIAMPQLEKTSYATSIIPTIGTAATRGYDRLTLSSSNVYKFLSWYNLEKGTFVIEYQQYASTNASPRVTDMGSDGAAMNQSGTTHTFNYAVASANQASIARTSASATANAKSAFVFSLNDFALSTNGGTVGTDVSGNISNLATLMYVGNNGAGSRPLSGWVKEIRFYPARVSDADLQAVTT